MAKANGIDKEKLTNGDRIRCMSDEELAKVIDPTEVCVHRTIIECIETYGNKCGSCILAWLKQEAE
jgi:hypothetical protein